MTVTGLDHLVLTVASLDETVDFYTRALGMALTPFAGGRIALSFGAMKINLHQAGREFKPKATHPTPGSADLCFIVDGPIGQVLAHLTAVGVPIEQGPVDRSGARGPIRSVYVRDPDGNLVELATYDTSS